MLGQLQGSQSQLSPALVKHARRLTLRTDDADTVRVRLGQSAASMGLALQEGCPAAFPCRRGESWRVRVCVLARSDTDVYGARSVAMAGSACAQEEHRSERRPNGRTSARGGALSEWSRGRRAFANAAAQRCKSRADCHGPSPRSCHSASCRPRRRPNASSPTLYRAESLGSFQPQCMFPPMGSHNFSSKNAAMQPAPAGTIGLLTSGRVGLRLCLVADSSWRRLAR